MEKRNKNNVVVNGNSSGDGVGNVHLLHTSENQASLVDEYLKLVCEDCDVAEEKLKAKKKKKSILLPSAADDKGLLSELLVKFNFKEIPL